MVLVGTIPTNPDWVTTRGCLYRKRKCDGVAVHINMYMYIYIGYLQVIVQTVISLKLDGAVC